MDIEIQKGQIYRMYDGDEIEIVDVLTTSAFEDRVVLIKDRAGFGRTWMPYSEVHEYYRHLELVAGVIWVKGGNREQA
jgi:hypothetical protein